MQTIAKEYLVLFNALTDAETALRQMEERLMEAQRRAEELFLEAGDGDSCPRETERPL